MSSASDTLRAATAAIWTAPLAGLDGLAVMHRPPSSDLPKRLYANFDAYWLAGVLYQLREMTADQQLDLPTLAKVAAMLADVTVRRFKTWGLQEAAATISIVIPEIRATRDSADLRQVLAELVTFIDRVHVWIDSTIPWARMDTLSPLPAQRGAA